MSCHPRDIGTGPVHTYPGHTDGKTGRGGGHGISTAVNSIQPGVEAELGESLCCMRHRLLYIERSVSLEVCV